MAWFISFSKKIPPGVPPRDYHQYTISTLQLDYSEVGEIKKPNEEDVSRVIKQFEAAHGVTNWNQVADHYRFSEVDYL